MLVQNIHWILIEDASQTSELVRSLLVRADLSERSTLLNAKTPSDFKLKEKVQKLNNILFIYAYGIKCHLLI